MEDCIFCKISQEEINCEKVYETENVISFLDINPKAPGHTLVIPKKHIEVLIDSEDELISEIFNVVKRVEEILKESLNPDAFTIGINDGEAAGQEIPHLHVNIIPRFEGDKGEAIHSVVNNPPQESISEISKKIKKNSNSL